MRCNMCGAKIKTTDSRCSYCGAELGHSTGNTYTIQEEERTNVLDTPSKGLNILALFFPFIMFFVGIYMLKKTPIRAKGIITYSIIGFVIEVIFEVLDPIFVEILENMSQPAVPFEEETPQINGGGGSTLYTTINLIKNTLQIF